MQKERRSLNWTWERENQAGFAILFVFDLGQVSLYFCFYLTGLNASEGKRQSQGYEVPWYSQVEDIREMQILVMKILNAKSYCEYEVAAGRRDTYGAALSCSSAPGQDRGTYILRCI